MPHEFHITINDGNTGEKERLHGQFSDEDWKSLTRFLALSFRLAECRIAVTRDQLNFGISGGGEKPVTFSATLPPEDDIAAFLHRMRPFILKREPSNFYRVRNLLTRYMTHPQIRRHLDGLRDLYEGKKVPFSMGYNDTEITPIDTVDSWLNASEYHQDEDKQAEMDALYSVFPEPSARALFLTYMLERANAIGKLGEFVNRLDKRDGEIKKLG